MLCWPKTQDCKEALPSERLGKATGNSEWSAIFEGGIHHFLMHGGVIQLGKDIGK